MGLLLLTLTDRQYSLLKSHLLPPKRRLEEAAFVFTLPVIRQGDLSFRFLDWFPIEPDAFLHRSSAHLELRDEIRPRVIKRAHDLGASLVEFHSHLSSRPPQFSPSDIAGFEEFVPHVRWRLNGRPYLAIVMASGGFDALVWVSS